MRATMIRQFELVERVKAYDPACDEQVLNRGYVFAMKAHGTQRRANGDPYFCHPLEVAGILTHYRLDTASIVTALLHDAVEDTTATLDDIRLFFGDEIARLVDGVTKLNRIELQSERSKQAENFRKFVLAMSQDIRVLLVKLADRLHNMRTLHFIGDAEKRRRIASETMEIYAPLAERIGMQEMKNELEDLAFAELNPHGRDSILARLKFLREHGGDLVPRIVEQLRETLQHQGLQVECIGREKTPYSIWLKMQKNNLSFEQLCDIMAFRVIVHTLEDCYRALGIVHGAYPVVPGRFKDYISVPKPNGYRSVHTAVFGPERQRIEIQIRSREMHEVAEFGVAAHWHYKQGGSVTDGRQYRWIRHLLDILEQAGSADDFLENTKLQMFQDEVFCFTPKGDLISLPSGATPVDFAYAVHSEIGDHCVGAKVNGRMVPLRTVLQNGDQVDIVTSRAQVPSPSWERFAVTGKARARIRRFIRTRERDQYAQLGRSILEKTFHEEGHEFTGRTVEEAVKILKAGTAEDLCVQVGAGHTTARSILETVFPATKKRPSLYQRMLPRSRLKRVTKPDDTGVPILGLIPGMAIHFAGCCHPLPGDRIVGVITTGKGVTIHTIDCEGLEVFAGTPERWIDLSWNLADAEATAYIGRLQVTVLNELGSLGNLTTLIAKNEGNITNLKLTNRSLQFFDILVDIEVRDVKHLNEIIGALRSTTSVTAVERARG